ncbi:adenylyl-sulfate kinase [bacterium]|nr:adenylyl-sulfate kinase [bacterium]
MTKNVYKQDTGVDRAQRESLNNHKATALWFTGLSGSGKSTIAAHLQTQLLESGIHCYMLDGDNIRLGINSDLDFTSEGRKENIRRIAEIAKLFVDSGTVVLCSFISPMLADRQAARDIIGTDDFTEVFVDCPLEICEQRDVKGLYARARKGEIPNFTGIDSPYEKPENAEITVHSDQDSIETCSNKILTELLNKIKS